ncbi:MAG: response regulator [Acidimicrobiales bacterium]
MTLKVVLADDHELIRHGLAAVLDTIEGVDLVAECADHPQLMSAVADHRPDVVITDIRMPPTGTDEGIAAALAIREDHPDTGVIVLSQFAEAEYVLELFVDGSQGLGYLLKDKVSRAELERAVLEVSSGGSAVDAAIVEVLVSGRRQQSPIDLLTPREQEVLGLIAEGRNNASVAAELVLSAKAVSKHINSIFSKLALGDEPDSHSRVKAVLLWLASNRA